MSISDNAALNEGSVPATVVATKEFRMERGQLALTMLALYGLWPVGILSILGLGALVGGIISDIRWTIVFFMIIFIFAPALLCYLYFYHGLRPLTALNSVPHRLLFKPDNITIEVYEQANPLEEKEEPASSIPASENEISSRESKNDRNETTGKIKAKSDVGKTTKAIHATSVSYQRLLSCTPGRSGYILLFGTPEKCFLWFPYNAFPDSTHINLLLDLLRREISPDNPTTHE